MTAHYKEIPQCYWRLQNSISTTKKTWILQVVHFHIEPHFMNISNTFNPIQSRNIISLVTKM